MSNPSSTTPMREDQNGNLSEAPLAQTIVEEIWFDDGNIIVRAGNRIFRVWKSFLSAKSPVFLDMLSLPAADEQEHLYGCPVVALPDDAEEVTYFLKALFHSDFFMPPPAHTELAIVAGVMRLSNKYSVDYLFHRALLHLEPIIPTTLEAYDDDLVTRTVDFARPREVLAFWELVREMDISWAIPVAGFYCTTRSIHEIMTGIDGLYMTHADQYLVLKAKQKLETTLQRRLYKFLTFTNVVGCDDPARCNTQRLRRLANELTYPYRFSFKMKSILWEGFAICPACRTASQAAFDIAKHQVWDMLPELFGCPSWAELEVLREKTIADRGPQRPGDTPTSS